MNSYLIVGQQMVGDTGPLGVRNWEKKEVNFTAETDDAAKEKAKKEYPYITDQELYRLI